MPAQFLTPALATLALLAGAGFALAQDPTRDLPWRRVEGNPEPSVCIERGLDRLEAGWDWEAARMFRELIAADKKRALGHLLLALATREHPNRAARFCWEAIARLPAPGMERLLVEAYQRYFGVTRQPEFVDERYQHPPGRLRHMALIVELMALCTNGPGWYARLYAIESARPDRHSLPKDPAATLSSHNAYLQKTGAMPYLIPGYRALLELHLKDAPDRDRQLERLPRHPLLGAGNDAAIGPLPGFVEVGPERWQPRQSPGFDLPRSLGGRGKYADYQGKPVLVVFFLGFG